MPGYTARAKDAERNVETTSSYDAIRVTPTAFIQDGAPITVWTDEEWTKWLRDAYRQFNVPQDEHIERFDKDPVKKMGKVMEQLTEGLTYFNTFLQNQTRLVDTTIQHTAILPDVYIANDKVMKAFGHQPNDLVFYYADKNAIYVNVREIANHTKYDFYAFHPRMKSLSNGQQVEYRYTSYIGDIILDAIEQMAYADFHHYYQEAESSVILGRNTTLRDFDRNPSIMYSLLAQVSISTHWMDTLFIGSQGKLREGQYRNINDQTVIRLMNRINTAWDYVPRDWKNKLRQLKDAIYADYDRSRTDRGLPDLPKRRVT